MAAKYTESEVPEGDPRNGVLEALAGGNPWLFVTSDLDSEGGLSLRVETGGGIASAATVRNMLTKILAGLP
jgi:hypothetical protein